MQEVGGDWTREEKCCFLGCFTPVWFKKSRCELLCHSQCLSGAGMSPGTSAPQPGCGPRGIERGLWTAKPQQ